MSSAAATSSEFVVRLPQEANKTYHLMRFSKALNVDVKSWTKNSVRLERESSSGQREVKSVDEEAEAPRFGAGSEFGKAERDEARAKKYAPRKRAADDKQWILRVGSKSSDKSKGQRKFRGMREGQFCENAAYYIFFQAHDGAFEAVPVSEWYNFNLQAKYKALTAEEAEIAYEKINKIQNFSLVMKSMKGGDTTSTDPSGDKSKKKGRSSGFRVTDEDEWGGGGDSDDASSGGGGSGDEKVKKKSNKNKKTSKKKKRRKGGGDDEDEYDSDPAEESDEGDFDQREMDYISDSSSSDDDKSLDRDNENGSDLKGVADEDALRQLALSEDESEEEDAATAAAAASAAGPDKAANLIKPDPDAATTAPDSESSASSDDSDDSDLDDEERYKAMFMQKKAAPGAGSGKSGGGGTNSGSSRSQTPIREIAADNNAAAAASSAESAPSVSGSIHVTSEKRKLEETAAAGPAAKKLKSGSESEEGLSEEAVRRYLMRKPMTAKDLLKKFKSKVKKGDGDTKEVIADLGAKMASILKKINPDKQRLKDELYFSLKHK